MIKICSIIYRQPLTTHEMNEMNMISIQTNTEFGARKNKNELDF